MQETDSSKVVDDLPRKNPKQKVVEDEVAHDSVDFQKVDQMMRKYALTDTEIFDVAVNFSIIKHNEFKSMNAKRPLAQILEERAKPFKQITFLKPPQDAVKEEKKKLLNR